jgi:hypothetical protein
MADKRYSVAVSAITARLSAAVPAALTGGVYYPNAPGWTTPAGKPWARLSVIPTASTNVATGGGQTWVRRNGLIVVDVFTPKASGINTNQAICDAITELFENTEFGNVKTFEANTAKIEDEPWLGYQVNINFYCEGL